MAYEIAVWVTKSLNDKWNGDALTAAQNYIDKTLEEATSESVYVTSVDQYPDPPRENIVDSGWPDDVWVCGSQYTYDNLLDWWEDWHICNGLISEKDGNILLTNYDSTYGRTGGYCDPDPDDLYDFRMVAEASEVGALHGTIEDKGVGLKYSQMFATVIHEVGHTVSHSQHSTNCVGDYDEEFNGYSYYDSSTDNNYTSPMVTWAWNHPDGTHTTGSSGENNCCDQMTSKQGKNNGWERQFSSCHDSVITGGC